jgi:hypothetical protein
MRIAKLIILSAVCATLSSASAADWLHAGLLFDDSPLTLASGQRTEAVGPFFYSEQKEETEKTWAVPPLTSHWSDSAIDSEEFDFLYPLLTYDRFGTEYRWQLLQVLSFAGGNNQADQDVRRFTIYPLYFQQRSADTNRNYTAFVPFYGHLQKRLMIPDKVFFVMFPLYAKTEKKDVVTDNYVYPFFHLRHGNSLTGWQFWPIVGHEHKDITSATNGYGEISMVPGHDRRFILWPIYLNDVAGIGTTNQQDQVAVLPLFSTLRSPLRDSTTVGWPFFTHVTDREKKYSEWQLPWPLIVFARGEGKTTSRVWPFYSNATNSAGLESRFYLWPVYKYNHLHAETVDRERTRILFFLYSDTRQQNLETGKSQRRADFFPFYTWRRELNGNTRLQVLSILEPFLPQSKSIERNYSQLWSIWRQEKNASNGARSQSLLWNLYRHDTAPESRKCSLLFGLFQYQSTSDGKQLRLFYIPVVNTKPTANPAK